MVLFCGVLKVFRSDLWQEAAKFIPYLSFAMSAYNPQFNIFLLLDTSHGMLRIEVLEPYQEYNAQIFSHEFEYTTPSN